jgi:LysR family hydrogen peroxide-inducible transcriptional activator
VAAVREVLGRARALEELGGELADPVGGTVSVGIIPTLAPYLLPRLHVRLAELAPRLRVRWNELKTADLEEQLPAGTIDLGVLATVPTIDGLDARRVGHEPFVAVLPGEGEPAPVSLDTLADRPMLLLDDGHCFRDQALAVCRRHALGPAPFRATSLATLVQMVGADLGVTLLPACAVGEAERARVHLRPLVEDVGRDVVVAWRRSYPRGPLVRRFAEAVQGVMRDGVRGP